jgi:hypothetical protein
VTMKAQRKYPRVELWDVGWLMRAPLQGEHAHRQKTDARSERHPAFGC